MNLSSLKDQAFIINILRLTNTCTDPNITENSTSDESVPSPFLSLPVSMKIDSKILTKAVD